MDLLGWLLFELESKERESEESPSAHGGRLELILKNCLKLKPGTGRTHVHVLKWESKHSDGLQFFLSLAHCQYHMPLLMPEEVFYSALGSM